MRRALALVPLLASLASPASLAACGPAVHIDDPDGGGGGGGGGGADAARPPDRVRVTGTVWSPGADLASTLEENRFPIPGAAVIAWGARPDNLPQERYCNQCVEVPENVASAIGDPVTGAFAIDLPPGQTYYLTIQKGEFRRSTELQVPNTPGGTLSLDTAPGEPRDPAVTLPSRTDLSAGDNIPKIAMIQGGYEDMEPMFQALGFDYRDAGIDFDVYCTDYLSSCESGSAADLLGDPARLDQYNLIVVTCGEDWPGTSGAAANLRQWVKEGGKLYIDDFNYDFAEQVWPDFLTWYVSDDGSMGGSSGPCGSPSGTGECNNWSSYDFSGDPGDASFEAWLALEDVNRGAPLTLYAAWDYIYALGEGEVGVDEEFGTGPNDEVYRQPKVWMANADGVPWGATGAPATVSWPYYCGKVLYTVYHTHSGEGGGSYALLLQEKIMMYLIMEVQTCAEPVVVQ